MNLIYAFKYSVTLPQKKALFKLNRMSMNITTLYIITLIFLLNIPSQLTMMFGTEISDVPRNSYIIQVIIVYPFVILFSALVGITLIALTGLLLAKLLKRKLTFQQLWKMSAYAVTSPLLLYYVLDYMGVSNVSVNLLFLLILFFILIKMIIIYPVKKTI